MPPLQDQIAITDAVEDVELLIGDDERNALFCNIAYNEGEILAMSSGQARKWPV